MSELPPVRLEVSPQLRDDAWDRFLAAQPGVHFEQSSGWGAVKAAYGWQVLRLLAWQGDRLSGGVQVLTRRIGPLGTIAYVARGPVVAPERPELAARLAGEVGRIAHREAWLYCVFDYPYDAHALAAAMTGDGYEPHPDGIPPSGLLAATSVLDLRGSDEEVLGRMNRNTRRNIRAALASDLVVGPGSRADLPRFRELMLATCRRRGTAPTPPQEDFFDRAWQELGDRGWIRLFLVRHGQEPVGGLLAFTMGDTVRLWKSGWSGAQEEKFPNHLMFWDSIRWSREAGFKHLDLVWVDTEDARRIARGETDRAGFRDGTTYFKLGFGGGLHLCPPAQSRFFHPLARLGYRCGGRAVLQSPWFQRLLARSWSRMSRG